MKIRYYKDINGARWVGFGIANPSVFILSSAIFLHNGSVGL